MDCLFCKIVAGEIPSKKIFEDDKTLAFLDISPANPGHTLVIPKTHSKDIFEADAEDLKHTIAAVKIVAERVKERMGAEGINVVQNNGQVAGQVVHHTHFHVIPRKQGDKVVITYQRAQLEEQEMDKIQDQIIEDSSASSIDDDIKREFQ